jgi:hypothetical protein
MIGFNVVLAEESLAIAVEKLNLELEEEPLMYALIAIKMEIYSDASLPHGGDK